jgi:hypothetical protein
MRKGPIALLSAVALLVQYPTGSQASSPGLPAVESGHRPGPDALYLPAPDAPQLQNAGVWQADPILVSGAVAYSQGEFIYQDFLYDDHGAAGIPDPNAPIGSRAHLFSPTAGTYTYPTNPRYANNAADLVEFRIKPTATDTHFRFTLNSMVETGLTAITVAFGPSSPEPTALPTAWPLEAGVRSISDTFFTVIGDQVQMYPEDGQTVFAPAIVDQVRRQVSFSVPRSTWDPGDEELSVVVGVGLRNLYANAYLQPMIGPANAMTPGGASPLRTALVNVGPRLNEPNPDLATIPTYTIGDAAAGAAVQAHWWRERQQADQLRLGDVQPFATPIDFGALREGVEDDSRVPKTGPINRILASRYEFGQGLDPSKVCFSIGGANLGAACQGRLVGQLQPYALYIPEGEPPAEGWGIGLLLHSLSANQNQYSGSRNQSQMAALGGGTLVITPSGRGPDGFYAGTAEADTFETWADVVRHYPVNPDRAVVSGYSMGGFGTYRLLARFPDLFSSGFAVVSTPGAAGPLLAGLRNTPLVTWAAVADELVPVTGTEATLEDLEALGLRFSSRLFLTADHLTLATNDEYQEGFDQLPDVEVDRDPMHVTFVVDPAQDSLDVVADHAYWLSGITRRGTSGRGTIDAVSGGFGYGDAAPMPLETAPGVMLGGNHGPKPHLQRDLRWGAASATPITDSLQIRATGVAAVTIDPVRARISCSASLDVQTDGPLAVTITGCGTHSFG